MVALKVMPEGRAPDWDSAGAGDPLAVTVNVLGTHTAKLVLLALVIVGADPRPLAVPML